MGVPCKKPAKHLSRLRRSNGYYHFREKSTSVCPNCGERKLPHRVCPNCGFYNGKQIVAQVVKSEE